MVKGKNVAGTNSGQAAGGPVLPKDCEPREEGMGLLGRFFEIG